LQKNGIIKFSWEIDDFHKFWLLLGKVNANSSEFTMVLWGVQHAIMSAQPGCWLFSQIKDPALWPTASSRDYVKSQELVA